MLQRTEKITTINKKEIVKKLLKQEISIEDEVDLIEMLIDKPITIDVDKQEDKTLTKIKYILRRVYTGFKNIFLDSDVIIDFVGEQPCRYWSKANLINVHLGAYSYIADNSSIRNTTIGRFCSIGSNVRSGLAYHPTSGFTTS